MVSAVPIFFVNFMSWVIIGHHNPDWAALPNQAENIRKPRELNLESGRCVCFCDRSKEEREDETVKAAVIGGCRRRPVGHDQSLGQCSEYGAQAWSDISVLFCDGCVYRLSWNVRAEFGSGLQQSGSGHRNCCYSGSLLPVHVDQYPVRCDTEENSDGRCGRCCLQHHYRSKFWHDVAVRTTSERTLENVLFFDY